jgi:hypothetical protein
MRGSSPKGQKYHYSPEWLRYFESAKKGYAGFESDRPYRLPKRFSVGYLRFFIKHLKALLSSKEKAELFSGRQS